MNHGKLRKDKICLNCGNDVEDRFCPHCGQENIEPKQPFHYLFLHFIEDFTHYDGQFWKTIKYLLFYPGKLTKEYLAGKRQSYVAPVKLYIFISFVTFFIFSFSLNNETEKPTKHQLTNENVQNIHDAKDKIQDLEYTNLLTKEQSLKIKKNLDSINTQDTLSETAISNNSMAFNISSIEQYDSIAAIKKGVYTIFRPFAIKAFELKDKNLTNEQIMERFSESIIHNLPKALFFYLPFFAFILWLFHNKKKWLYFDHGIFTLHYFSFLLLIILIINYIPNLNGAFGFILNIIEKIIVIYSMLYFLIAHHNIYETAVKSTIYKGIGIFIINSFLLLLFAVLLVMVSILLMH